MVFRLRNWANMMIPLQGLPSENIKAATYEQRLIYNVWRKNMRGYKKHVKQIIVPLY